MLMIVAESDFQTFNINETEREVLSLENEVGNLRFREQQDISMQHSNDSSSPGSMPNQSLLSLTDGSTTVPSSNDSILDFDDSSLAEFLRDVMMPPSPNSLVETSAAGFLPQNYYGGRDVFNFGMDSSLDFNDLDFNWIDSQQYRQPQLWASVPANVDDMRIASQETPDLSSGTTAGAEAFQRSVWRYKPGPHNHACAEQVHLSVPYKDMQHLEVRLPPDLLGHRIEQTARDKILAMVLGTCERANASQVVTSFPSADFLDSLMHNFFRSELSREDSWIHIPTFRPQANRAEWNAMVVAAGAVLSSVPTVRKLGYAIQEAVRMTVPAIVKSSRSLE